MTATKLLNSALKTTLALLLTAWMAGCTPSESSEDDAATAPTANTEAAKQAPAGDEGATETVDADALDDALSQDAEGSRPKALPTPDELEKSSTEEAPEEEPQH